MQFEAEMYLCIFFIVRKKLEENIQNTHKWVFRTQFNYATQKSLVILRQHTIGCWCRDAALRGPFIQAAAELAHRARGEVGDRSSASSGRRRWV